ncbi:hypothetical protein [Tautonia rosea]|uniref:hypothetical protein n=1 Tax=Tautonia rosea TaxID=2728037 RepID=UPI001473F17A|nr:hypothetical protein [Tautonia rosea]
MLPTNFADLAERQPQLRSVLDTLAEWIENNPHLDYIDIRRVVSERPGIDTSLLAVALVSLERIGILREKFGLIAPTNHVLADDFYDSLRDIPPESHDTTDRSFDTGDAEVIPVYVGVDR